MEIRELRNQFEEKADPDKADRMAAYMKGLFPFYGIQSPQRKTIFNMYWRELPDKSVPAIIAMVDFCWLQPQREWQYFATDLLGKVEKKLTIDDLPFIENLIMKKSWWDSVDYLATHPVGQILSRHPDKTHATIDRYLQSGHLWLQRTALIFQLFYKDRTDFDLMKVCIFDLTDKGEFFLNKGAGWALRQYSKSNPSAVKEFIDLHPELPGLTIREGSKYMERKLPD